MAVTSIWPIKSNKKLRTIKNVIDYARNPEKTVERDPDALAPLHAIDGVAEYAADEMKTETRAFVSVIHCISEETAAQEFMETKMLWDKTAGRLCFHGYQSFQADEVDAKTAHEIGVKLAERLWGDDFQVLIATHCNTGHYHNHFVLNSVSCKDGHHYHNTPFEYQRMREESDRLCREYRLSVIENPSGHGRNYAEYAAEKSGRTSLRKSIREDIDRAVAASLTSEEFWDYLYGIGYESSFYREDGVTPLKYPGLKPPGAKGYFRFHKLGEGYSWEEISDRILDHIRRRVPFPEAERGEVREHWRKSAPPQYERKKSGLYRLYLRYCYELHIIEKHPASVQRVSFYLREDIAKLDRLDAETRLLAKHGISTYEDMTAHKAGLSRRIGELEARRAELRNGMRRLKRGHELSTAETVKGQISDITKELRELRKEVTLCDDVIFRSARTREELEWLLDQQEIAEREEANHDELFRRRSGTGRENELGRY